MKFHLGVVLSITTSKLLCDMDSIYKICEHLAGEPVWTHQLPRVAREAKPILLAKYPALAVDVSGVTRENWESWLSERAAELGEWFEVEPLPASAHESIDPVSELVEMRGGR